MNAGCFLANGTTRGVAFDLLVCRGLNVQCLARGLPRRYEVPVSVS